MIDGVQRRPAFEGEFFRLPGVDVHPKPVQQPIRLWLGARAHYELIYPV